MVSQAQDASPVSKSSVTHNFLYLFGLCLVVFAITHVIQALRSPLRRVPGPYLARLTRFAEMYSIYKTDYSQHNVALHEQYGPVIRLAPNRYSIADADAAKEILGHKNSLDKTHFYDPFGAPGLPNLFSVRKLSVHATMRRAIAHLYSQSSLLACESAIDACNGILLKRLKAYASEDKTCDIRALMQYFTFDVIGEVTVGSRFGLMEDDGDKDGIIDAIQESLRYGTYVGLLPSLHLWIAKASEWLKVEPSLRKIEKFVVKHLNARISGQSKSPEGRADFLDRLLPLEQEGKVTRTDTLVACFQNIAAGSDTIAISLAAVFGYLAVNPQALRALRLELDTAIKQGALSNPPEFQEAQRLPYLHAVINEALRLHPAVGMPMMRVIGLTGAQLAGHYFPPGTEVGVNPWVMHNNKSIFGADAADFRPERWLEGTPAQRATLDRNMIAFGAGPRVCLGKNLSLLEMYKLVPQVVRDYDFDLIPDTNTEKPWTNSTAWFVWPDMKCKVRERR
ncbi:hypothetical protein NX059_004245 [Plenodomus lindquistii]|nr:hypothetical protein NX059_004245 [Plenodomus lindquistii]